MANPINPNLNNSLPMPGQQGPGGFDQPFGPGGQPQSGGVVGFTPDPNGGGRPLPNDRNQPQFIIDPVQQLIERNRINGLQLLNGPIVARPNGASPAAAGVTVQAMSSSASPVGGLFTDPFDLLQQLIQQSDLEGLQDLGGLTKQVKENADRKDVIRKVLGAINEGRFGDAQALFDQNKSWLKDLGIEKMGLTSDSSQESRDRVIDSFKGGLDSLSDVSARLAQEVQRGATIHSQLTNILSGVFAKLSSAGDQIINRIA